MSTASYNSAERTFTSGLGGRLANVVGAAVASAIVGYLLTQFALGRLLHIRNPDVVLAVFFGAIILGAGLACLNAFVTGPVRIVVNAQTVEVYKGRKLIHSLSRAEYGFGSFVTRQGSSGRVTERKLIAHSASAQLEIPCTWFTARDFDELIALVAPIVPTAPAHAAAPAAPAAPTFAVGQGVFTLDPRPRVTTAIVSLAILAAFAIAIAFAVAPLIADEPILSEGDLVGAALFGGLLLVAFGIPGVLLVGSLVRALRIPRRIELSRSTIVVDGRTFMTSQLRQVSLTPPSYQHSRRIVLQELTGARTRYLLEPRRILGTSRPVFANYDAFAAELTRSLPAGVMRYELS